MNAIVIFIEKIETNKNASSNEILSYSKINITAITVSLINKITNEELISVSSIVGATIVLGNSSSISSVIVTKILNDTTNNVI